MAVDGTKSERAGAAEEPASPPAAAPALPLDGPPGPEVSVKSIMLGTGPRFARDAFGPLLAFYLGWKIFGLAVGIGLSTVVSLWAWRYEKKRDRSGRMAFLSLGFVVVQAVIGLVSNSAQVYLAQPVLVNGAFGIAFIVSTFLGKPLAGLFAEEFYPFPEQVKESDTFRRVFSRISLAWGVYNLMRSGVRILVLTSVSVEAFLAINFVTGVPITMALMSWSIWYGVRCFRRSTEWGWAIEMMEGTAVS
jgi:intracellular septation protein A